MSGRTRDLLWLMSLHAVGVLIAAMVNTLPALVRIIGAAAAALPWAVWLWSVCDGGGPHIVYYLRGRGPRPSVLYVGVTSPRSGGPADLMERVLEHLDDADCRDWKHDVEPGNCTIARRCWTRRGALISERRRIRALATAARWKMCPPLRNEQHNRRAVAPFVAVVWYSVESRIVPGACWHRAALWTLDEPTAATPEPARRVPVSVPDDDELGFLSATAEAVRPPASPAPPAGRVELSDDEVDEAWADPVGQLEVEPAGDASTLPPGGDDVSAGGTPPLDVVHGEVELPVETVGDLPVEAVEAVGGAGETSECADETPENAASRLSGDGAAPDGNGGAARRPGGRAAKSKVCVEAGCSEAAVRYGRCLPHARAWDRERKRRKAAEDDRKDER